MCMKVFALHRCVSVDNGGCDSYYAEYMEDQECSKTMLPGLPQVDCRAVWAGFENEVSAKVNHRDVYAKKSKGPCPNCLYNRQIAYLEEQGELERKGEFSDRVHALVADLTRKSKLKHTDFMLRVYHELWDAARSLVHGLSAKTDAVWDGIETALRSHFGVEGMALSPVRALVASLRESKREVIGHLKNTAKEMAVALVGPNESWDDDLEAGGFVDEDWKKQRQASVDVSRERERAQK